ncbi:MAG: hypothetical protein QNK04_07505 [Myxococcota bacterium]|nr:hypothetical protein [Myxococcota bacterium]
MSAAGATESAALPFPSEAWFRKLAELMNGNRVRQEQLGYVDCVADFRVLDGGEGGGPFTVRVTFEEFEAVDVRTAAPGDGDADFVLEASLDTWRAMIESIARGGGRPDLEQTLNRLSHMGSPVRVHSEDPLRRDLYFRYNQSLQEFVNASGSFQTDFPAGRVAAAG